MSRDVKKCERQLIEILQNEVESSESDFKSRMINVDRDVFLDEPTYNVVEKTKITNTIPSIPEFYLAKNDDSLYICNTYNKQYDSVFLAKLKEIDDIKAYAEEINNEDEIEKAISDKSAGIGVSVLLIAYRKKKINSEVKILDIFDSIFALDEKKVDYDTIDPFFFPHSTYRLSDACIDAYKFECEEDLLRFYCSLEITNKDYLSEKTQCAIYDLLTLLSSRSIAELVVNICHTKDLKTVFLQLYRIIEYLFIIRKSLEMGEKYKIDTQKIIEMIINERTFGQSEEQQLLALISNYASDSAKEDYCCYLDSICFGSADREKTNERLSKYIYEQRCKIAHFKYRQEKVLDESNLIISNEKLAKLAYSMYDKLDEEIKKINYQNKIWQTINFENPEKYIREK